MKTIKILLPAAMTFAMFIGINNGYSQRNFTTTTDNTILNVASDLLPKKAIGLDYTKSLAAINEALTIGVKSDYTIDFQGKLMANIELDANGVVKSISFDKNISERLESAITKALKEATIAPVQLNGKPKAQTFKIPLIIK